MTPSPKPVDERLTDNERLLVEALTELLAAHRWRKGSNIQISSRIMRAEMAADNALDKVTKKGKLHDPA